MPSRNHNQPEAQGSNAADRGIYEDGARRQNPVPMEGVEEREVRSAPTPNLGSQAFLGNPIRMPRGPAEVRPSVPHHPIRLMVRSDQQNRDDARVSSLSVEVLEPVAVPVYTPPPVVPPAQAPAPVPAPIPVPASVPAPAPASTSAANLLVNQDNEYNPVEDELISSSSCESVTSTSSESSGVSIPLPFPVPPASRRFLGLRPGPWLNRIPFPSPPAPEEIITDDESDSEPCPPKRHRPLNGSD